MKDAPSDDHIFAIGRLVVAFSRLDMLLTDLISTLMRTHFVSCMIATHHQQISSKIDTLLALCRLWLGDAAKGGVGIIEDNGYPLHSRSP